jgi:hypothetical protein
VSQILDDQKSFESLGVPKIGQVPYEQLKGFWGPQFQALLLHDLPLGAWVNITL